MRDIQSRNDLEYIIQQFYKKALNDPIIGFIFTDIAQINLEEHLPIIADFWEMSLFHKGSYKRNTLQKHLNLHEKYPLQSIHFQTWVRLFQETVAQSFQGEMAERAKQRAQSIAQIIQMKIEQKNSIPPI